MIPRPGSIGLALIGPAFSPSVTVARKPSPSGSGRYTAMLSAWSSSSVRSAIRTRTSERSGIAESSRAISASAAISPARRRISSYSRALPIATPTVPAIVVSRRVSVSPNRPSWSELWMLITPIASSSTTIGTPRYDPASSSRRDCFASRTRDVSPSPSAIGAWGTRAPPSL